MRSIFKGKLKRTKAPWHFFFRFSDRPRCFHFSRRLCTEQVSNAGSLRSTIARQPLRGTRSPARDDEACRVVWRGAAANYYETGIEGPVGVMISPRSQSSRNTKFGGGNYWRRGVSESRRGWGHIFRYMLHIYTNLSAVGHCRGRPAVWNAVRA